MDMTIYCGKCGKKITVDGKKAGQKIVCVRCQTKLPLPSQPTDEPQIRLYCFGCGHRVRADVDQAGGEMRCPKCEHVIPLPELDDALVGLAKDKKRSPKVKAEEEEEEEKQDERPQKKRPRKKKRREPQTVDYKISKEMRKTIDRIERDKSDDDEEEDGEDEEEEKKQRPRKRPRRDEEADDFAEVVPISEGPGPLKVFLIVFVIALFIAIALGVVAYMVMHMRQGAEGNPSKSRAATTRSAE